MTRDTFAAPAVFEAIGHHRRTCCRQRFGRLGHRPITRPSWSCRRRERASARWFRRRRSVRPLDLAPEHSRPRVSSSKPSLPIHCAISDAVEIDLVAGVDGLLPIERQTVGIFGDGDLGQKRLGRNAALDDMGWSRRLDHAVAFLKAYLGRRVTITRNFAGNTSRRSDTSSPIRTFSSSSQPAGISGSMTISTRSR